MKIISNYIVSPTISPTLSLAISPIASLFIPPVFLNITKHALLDTSDSNECANIKSRTQVHRKTSADTGFGIGFGIGFGTGFSMAFNTKTDISAKTRVSIKFKAYFLIVLLSFFSLFLSDNAHSTEVKLTNIKTAEVVDLNDFKGRYVYIDFWASWCVPCKASFPFMVELQKQYPKLVILAVTVDADKQDAMDFLAAVPHNFEIFHDPEGEIAALFKVSGMPSSYIIDPNGNVVARHVGFSESAKGKIKAEIDGFLMKH